MLEHHRARSTVVAADSYNNSVSGRNRQMIGAAFMLKLTLVEEQSDQFYTRLYQEYKKLSIKDYGLTRQYQVYQNNDLIAELQTIPSGDNLEIQLTDSTNMDFLHWLRQTYNTKHGQRCYFTSVLDQLAFNVRGILPVILSAAEDSSNDGVIKQRLEQAVNGGLPELPSVKSNGAGRKPAGKETKEAKLKLLDLTEQVKSTTSCKNWEQAVARAYEMLDPKYQIWLDGIPAWPTVKGWRKLRNKPDE